MPKQSQSPDAPIRDRPKKRAEAKKKFVEMMNQTGNVSHALSYAEISRTTYLNWRKKDTIFAEACDEAIEKRKDFAREILYSRAFLGWDEPVVSGGRVVRDEEGNVLTVRRYSDQIAMLYAKTHLDDYKEQKTAPVEINTQIISLAEAAKQDLLASLASSIVDAEKA